MKDLIVYMKGTSHHFFFQSVKRLGSKKEILTQNFKNFYRDVEIIPIYSFLRSFKAYFGWYITQKEKNT